MALIWLFLLVCRASPNDPSSFLADVDTDLILRCTHWCAFFELNKDNPTKIGLCKEKHVLHLGPGLYPNLKASLVGAFVWPKEKTPLQRRTGWHVSIHRMGKGPGRDPAGES